MAFSIYAQFHNVYEGTRYFEIGRVHSVNGHLHVVRATGCWCDERYDNENDYESLWLSLGTNVMVPIEEDEMWFLLDNAATPVTEVTAKRLFMAHHSKGRTAIKWEYITPIE